MTSGHSYIFVHYIHPQPPSKVADMLSQKRRGYLQMIYRNGEWASISPQIFLFNAWVFEFSQTISLAKMCINIEGDMEGGALWMVFCDIKVAYKITFICCVWIYNILLMGFDCSHHRDLINKWLLCLICIYLLCM